MLFSLTMLPPIAIGELMGDPDLSNFWWGFGSVLLAGILLWLPFKNYKNELRLRDGYLIAVLFWVGLSVAATIPLSLSTSFEISLANAFFETVSGFTTTGATVLVGLDSLPRSINFYRMELHWLGGMGMIVLAVAILPMLGIGGMQLYKAETPGPVKDSKLTPRITETARLLWYVYLILTLIGIGLFLLGGMTWFDAVCHAFSAVSTGGFSTHDSSMGYFNSAFLEYSITFIMIMGGVNFTLHFTVLHNKSLKYYWLDSEFKLYLLIMFVVFVICAGVLWKNNYYTDIPTTVRYASFQVASIMTSTGLLTTNMSAWPTLLPVLLMFVSFVGGCAGSTGGGLKVIRFLLLMKQGWREVSLLTHPHAHTHIKINREPVPESVTRSIWGFFSMYVAVFTLFMLGMMAAGHDQVTSFSAVAATLNNMGVGLGEVSSSFSVLDDFTKWWLSFAMLMGRLELFTVLVLFSPSFWRR
ncbi:TrkH family potassium uptake protein [uncultured Thiothrix sp.]|uniref:TrkH family potassium uptake protein n=1 Tax=uncultured Thiothrix sp. TaxID=223185 RepID=UPI00345DDDDB